MYTNGFRMWGTVMKKKTIIGISVLAILCIGVVGGGKSMDYIK